MYYTAKDPTLKTIKPNQTWVFNTVPEVTHYQVPSYMKLKNEELKKKTASITANSSAL